jgi:hypothetical protein
MKNILKSTAVAALMFTSFASMAYQPGVRLVNGMEAKSLVFEMVSASETSIVSMRDQDQNIIFYDNVTGSDYAKKFNLKNLKTGTYYLEVENTSQFITYTLSVENKEVKIINQEEKFTPVVFGKEGNKVRLNLENSDLSKVEIKIMNENNAKVFGESLASQKNIDKTFNFEKAVKGVYMITVKDGKKVYYQNVSVD